MMILNRLRTGGENGRLLVYPFYLSMITSADLLLYLQITIAVLLLIVLYHILFAVVDLRKIMRRIEGVTQEVEDVIMKPISMIDSILEWVLERIEKEDKSSRKKLKSGKKK